MKRKLLSIVLALCLTLTLLPTMSVAAGSYADTNGHWAETAIERWSSYGILQGSDGKFAPDGTLTRAQMATILSRLLNLPAAESVGFTDVPAGEWYADAINRCAAAGILQGTDGKANPNAPITREQAMVMLCRALGIEALSGADLSGYPDGAQVSPYAQGYVAALVRTGIVKGDVNGKLNPAGVITRAEIVTIVDRMVTVYANADGAAVSAANGGTVLVVAKNVKVENAPEGTKIIAGKDASGLSVNGKAVSAGQTYIVPAAAETKPSTSGNVIEVPPHAHIWGVWEVTTAPSCTAEGVETRFCTVCGGVETRGIAKLAHTAGAAATCTTAQVCTVCGQVIAPATGHTWGVSKTETKCDTTVTTYTCSVCHATKMETAAGGSHTAVEEAAVAPTCTADGTTAGTKCSVCGAILSGCETVLALGHAFGETWTSDGTSHWHACTRCDAKSAEAEHVYERTTTDWTSAELKTGMTCTVCGHFDVLSGQGIYYVANVADLEAFAEKVNGGTSFAGKTVKLTADIDLANEPWTPIGKSGSTFQGTFDGQGHTISNLKTGSSWKNDVGLFGFTTNGEVKNFTLQNADVTGYLDVGAIAGTPYTSKYTNITLCGKITVNGYAYVGGAFGKNAYANLTNITINADEGSYVKADSEIYRTYVGGLVGFMGEGRQVVKDVTSNIDVIGSTCDVGGITGIAHYGNSFINCSSSGNVRLENAQDEGDHLEIGGIAGVWLNTAGQTVTFTNCSFTGTLSTKLNDVDKTAELSALHRIVGSKYTPDSNDGTLIIDGKEMVTVTPSTIPSPFKANTTYLFTAGNYGEPHFVITDKENVTLIGQPGAEFGSLQISSIDYVNSEIGQEVDLADSTLTVKGFNVSKTLMIVVSDKNVVVTDNVAAQITVKTNVSCTGIAVNANKLTGGENAANKYGVYIVPNITNYDLTITGNTFENIVKHAISVQGCGDGSAVTAANSITVDGNQFNSYGTDQDSRAAFKIWEDTKLAPDSTSELNDAAKALAASVQAKNIFAATLDGSCILADFYGKTVRFSPTSPM